MKNSKKLLSLILCVALIVALVLSAAGCGGSDSEPHEAPTEEIFTTDNPGVASEPSVLGEGDTVFIFSTTDADGNETQFEIHTDKETVGEALVDLGLISGEESEFGLYVKTVNGITADFDTDGTYWAFYIDGEYASTGVDTTSVEEGKTYSFKVEK